MNKIKKTRRREALCCPKTVWAVLFTLFFTLFLPMISGFEFDNIGEYDPETHTMTIINAFGLGDTIAEITLLSPEIVNVFAGEERLVAWYQVINYEEYDGRDVFGVIDTYDLKNGNAPLNKNFKFKRENTDESYYVDSPKYESGNCDENGDCENIQVGVNSEYVRAWGSFNKNNQLEVDTYIIGLFTEVGERDEVEWIPEMYGVRIDEWAVWRSSFNDNLVGYWKLDESAGDNALDSVYGQNGTIYNITGTSWVTGKKGNALQLDGGTAHVRVNASCNTSAGTLPAYNLSSNGTISIWMNASTVGTNDRWMQLGWSSAFYFRHHASGLTAGLYDGTAHRLAQNSTDPPVSEWIHMVGTFNGSTIMLYLNGVLASSTGHNGVVNYNGNHNMLSIGNHASCSNTDPQYTPDAILDEAGFWNRTLSSSEISDLYNGGEGVSYGEQEFEILLNNPTDNAEFLYGNITFSANYTAPVGMNFTNTTLWVWNSDGSVFGTNRTDVTGNNSASNSTVSLSISGLTGEATYSWNYYLCGRNISNGIVCEFVISNYTFSVINFIENSQTFNAQTIEKSTETFLINITIDSSRFTTVYPSIVYNGTSYIGTTTSTGNDRIYSASVGIPAVTTDTNTTFFWDFGFYDGATTYYSNSTVQNQTILNLNVDNCTAYSELIYNFTVRDEADRTILVGGTDNVTIELDLIISSLGTEDGFLNYSHDYPYTNPAQICLELPLNNSEYRVDLTGEYESSDYVKEYYYIDNGTITNDTVPQQIDLHDLLLADSTTFLFTFIDTDGLAVEEAIVHVDRKYTGEGIFREVERARTDDSGETHVHLVEEDVTYRFRITKDNALLYTSTDYQAKCLSTPCEIEIRASESYFDVDEDEWDSMEGGYYTISKDDSARQITLEFYSDPVSTLNINLTAFSYTDENGRQTVATNSLSATSGTITLTIPNIYGNQTYIYAIYQDNELVVWGWFSLVQSGIDFFGNTLGVILTAFLVLTLGLMAVTEGVAVIVFLILGLGIAGILKLLEISWVALIGIICAGGILIWKLTKRGGRR